MTPRQARELAETSTRHGYFDNGAEVYAPCPWCRMDIKVPSYVAGSYSPEAKVRRLHGAVLEHLTKWCLKADAA